MVPTDTFYASDFLSIHRSIHLSVHSSIDLGPSFLLNSCSFAAFDFGLAYLIVWLHLTLVYPIRNLRG